MLKRLVVALSLILSLSSCSTTTQTKYIVKRPPVEHTDRREIPEFEGSTVSDLTMYTLDLIGELEKSNLDKTKILRWFEELELELNNTQ